MADYNERGEQLGEEEKRQIRQRRREVHQKEREVLFNNEALVITVLQALAGGAMFALLANADEVREFLGRTQFMILFTTVDVALLLAVLTAFFKHQYKKWDVKAPLAKTEEEGVRRRNKTQFYLEAMRWGMTLSVGMFSLVLIEFPVFAWIRAVCVT